MSQAEPANTTTTPGDEPGTRLSNLYRQEASRLAAIKNLRDLRREASAEIARLIAFLDASDPYVLTELEDDDTREEGGDSEPSLGSFDRMVNQDKAWRQVGEWANCNDLEQDDADNEPSLASPENHVACSVPGVRLIQGEFRSTSGNQTVWAGGKSDDREDDAGDSPEEDPAEGGIGDLDGQIEQEGYYV